ncbi:hypothetical protein PV328_006366 [Microctonus aethiopoides]|uniref:Lipid storage droplets surface-binding protein 1 n=1 Tax=Microctonus aethiopoides TaxID=144406 RepID=A0AA39KTA7_9HYME|nr:hypothetical protein PV328_006366 [Microctonus aethiopoides]
MIKSTSQTNQQQFKLQLESIARLSSLPIVESSFHIANNVYNKIKRSNSLMNWSLDAAEQSLAIATSSAIPAIFILNKPILAIDHILSRGIEIVEQRVPAVHLPPQLLYWNTREFMNNKIVMPMLKRAGSVTQMSSQAANAAVDTLDGALTVADKYIDHYLPGDPSDKVIEDVKPIELTSKTARTIEHGARFSKKLQRRLTRRTLAEARALKHQGTECIHVLLYVTKLIVTDPKMAFKQAQELWASLSLSEPENQARPSTLEELLVLLTRETARRIVHLVNGSVKLAAMAPRRVGVTFMSISHQLLSMIDATLKMTPLIGKREAVASEIFALEAALHRLSISVTLFLESTAVFLAGRPESKKLSASRTHELNNHNNHVTLTENYPLNGTD